MEEKLALAAFAALAHETSWRCSACWCTAGPSGLPAGDIAERLGVVASTLSFHLKELDRAGLLRSWRRQRQIFYAADYEGTRTLLAFLTRDCCQGHPEICGDLHPSRSGARTRGSVKAMADRPYNVLFLCTGNTARSIMAECALNRWGQGRFTAYSAGSQPKGRVHPMTVRLLSDYNFKTEGLRSKSWEEFTAPGAPELDFVFTVCDNAVNEVCPVSPGHR